MSETSSMYGGRRGASVLIVKSYSSIEEMISDFSSENCEVQYDEYVLINTINIDNPDNGKLFRRGIISNELNGAIYLGRIVGPSGGSSSIELTDISTINQLPIDTIANKKEGAYLPNKDLVPGYYLDEEGNPQYNDSIQWTSCSIQQDDGNSTVYIGFKIPYPVLDFNVTLVDSITDSQSVIEKVSDNSHPFYNKWNIKIPKGGGAGNVSNIISNIRIITANDSVEDYPNKQEDIENNREILVYNDTNLETGDIKTKYIGNYNSIQDVILSEDGTLTIKYSYNEDKIFNKVIKWIKSVSFSNDGYFTIIYNDNSEYKERFKYPTRINFNSIAEEEEKEGTGNQKIHVIYNDNSGEDISPAINYIMKTKITLDNHLIFLYSDPQKRLEIVEAGKNYPQEIDGFNDWEDMGSIKTDNGILIQTNLDPNDFPEEDLSNNNNIIKYLNTNYSQGLLNGKLISVGNINGNKSLFAFDYEYDIDGKLKGWYFLGNINTDQIFLIGKEDDVSLNEQFDNLSNNIIWFITEE